jgi:hypothetical protein
MANTATKPITDSKWFPRLLSNFCQPTLFVCRVVCQPTGPTEQVVVRGWRSASLKPEMLSVTG